MYKYWVISMVMKILMPNILYYMDVSYNIYHDKSDPDKFEKIFFNSTTASYKELPGNNRKQVLLINGFTGSIDSSWIRNMKNEILKKSDVNVIAVDSTHALRGPAPRYPVAVINAYIVGHLVSQFIKNLVMAKSLEYKDIHLIGISLGAQVSGITGFFLDGKLGRISGLDPAGPLYNHAHKDFRLESSDALFVDVYMTDIMDYTQFAYGIYYTDAHVNIHVNGGKHQPTCEEDNIGLDTCSHTYSANLYLASIQNICKLEACECQNNTCLSSTNENCVNVGYDMPTNTRGNFYLNTTKFDASCIPDNSIWE